MRKKSLASKLLVSFFISISCHSVLAEEAKPADSSVEWTAYFDFYSLSSPQAHAAVPATPGGPRVIEGRYFDKQVNQMTLNMAEISFKKRSGKVSFRADLAAGEMVDQLSSGGSQSVTGTGAGQNPTNLAANEPTRNLTQATLSYALSDRFSITAGKFYSHMGLEVTKAKDNWQYSRSYTYNYGIPFWHQGISATYAVVPGAFATTVYALNAWDGRISQEQNKSTSLGANLNFTGIENLVANYNYLGGAETTAKSRREAHEVNLTYTLTPSLAFATDYVLGTQKDIPGLGDATSNVKWNGLAVYLKANWGGFYTFSPRYEIFDDSDSGFAIAGGLTAAATKQKITSWTLANNFDLGDGFEARLELRSDKSDSDLFFKDPEGAAIDHQESYTIALLYAF